jgi:hypothetical protein
MRRLASFSHAVRLAGSWPWCNTGRWAVVVQFEIPPGGAVRRPMAYCHDDSKAPASPPRSRTARRMGNRRMTRLTNAFSKKAANHAHMMAIYFMHYNFVRIHQSLKITPAMAADVTSKLWEMSDMLKVLEDWEAQKAAA